MKITREGRNVNGALWSGLGGDPDIPEGETPVDCCDPGEELPDRALDSAAFTISAPAAGGIVQMKPGLFETGAGGYTLSFANTPANGNTMYALVLATDGFVIDTAGWSLVDKGTANGDQVAVWSKVAGAAEPTAVHIALGGPTGTVRMVLYEVAGSHDVEDSTTDDSPASPLTGPTLTPGGTEGVLIAAFIGQVPTYGGDPTWGPLGALVTDSFLRQDPGRLVTWTGHQDTTTGSYTPSLTTTPLYAGRETASIAVIVDATPTEAVWNVPAPNTVDGNDATYEEIDGPDVLRLQLGDAFNIVSARLLIGSEDAGTVTYRIRGANEADFSDAVQLVSKTFDVTGSFTADDIDFLWSTAATYQYFELSGTDENRRIFSFELYEPSTFAGQDHNHDAIEAEIDALQEQLDELGATDGFVTKIDGGLETLSAHGAAGSTETIDLAAGNWHSLTLDNNCAITVVGFTAAAGCSALVKVTQDGTGNHAITWDSDIVWAGDDQPAQDPATVSWFVLASDEGDSVIYGFPVGGGGATIDPATTVVAQTAFGLSAVVGDDVEYARADHAHGTPALSGPELTAIGRWEPVQYDDGSSPWPFVYHNDEIVVYFVEA